MAEKQSKHRQELERMAVETNCISQRRGPIFGFIISMTVILGGFLLIYLGKDLVGISAVLGSLAALVAVFVYGKRVQTKQAGTA